MAERPIEQGYETEDSWAPSSSEVDEDQEDQREESNAEGGDPRSAKKRHLVDIPDTTKTSKRLKGPHNEAFRQLLNANILDCRIRNVPEDHVSLSPSQIGSSLWTAYEKHLFFDSLSRRGKCDIRGIAADVGTKSQYEVQGYVFSLQTTLEDLDRKSSDGFITLLDIPAATEVSEACGKQLESLADALSLRQEAFEQNTEQEKWGDFWLLNSETSAKIERRLETDAGRQRLGDMLPAIQLLNFRTWLKLSEDIFMNPSWPRDENWHFFANDDEEPSMTMTAFNDFYHLAVSLIRRLVASAHFAALSRLRASDSKGSARVCFIKAKDVETAVEVLGLAKNSRSFWAKCPRRCRLSVYEGHEGRSLAYRAVEEQLTTFEDPILTSRKSELDSISDDVTTSDTSGDGKSDVPVSEQSFDPAERLEMAYDDYADAADIQTSLHAEQELWAILRKPPPLSCDPESILVPEPQADPPKLSSGIRNWRDCSRYLSPWERTLMPPDNSSTIEPLAGSAYISEADQSYGHLAEERLRNLDIQYRTADEASTTDGQIIDWDEDAMDETEGLESP